MAGMVKMRALDSFHSDSTVPPGPHTKGDLFQVNDDFAKKYEAKGIAEPVTGGSKKEKAAAPHQNKADQPDQNKLQNPTQQRRSGSQTGKGRSPSSARQGRAQEE